MNEFASLTDLASARVGGKVLFANDDFFAPKENLLKVQKAVFIADKFTPRGKWMDGWESRRRREPGHDWCLVRLGLRGVVRGVVVDTAFFTGNYPESCAISAADAEGASLKDLLTGKVAWREILPKSGLKGNSENAFAAGDGKPATHLRFDIFPDGGVARLRVHGDVAVDWGRLAKAGRTIDLAAVENGGLALAASDEHFGRKENLLMPGRAPNMGDGWETRRSRAAGHVDWVVLRLGGPGRPEKIEVDTNHFKGNYPDSCRIEGAFAPGAGASVPQSGWTELLPQTKLRPNKRHFFAKELAGKGPFTHLRLTIYPDGGVSRLRVHGKAVLA